MSLYAQPSLPAPTIRIYVRDAFNRRIGEIDDYSSLTLTRKHAGIGSWQMDMQAQTASADLMLEGTGLIIERNGTVLATGPIARRRRVKNATSDHWTVAGYEDSVWLNRRKARPTFTEGFPNAFLGPADRVIKQLVEDACVFGDAARRVPFFTVAPIIGDTRSIIITPDWQPLDELATKVSLASGEDLGYRARQDGREGFAPTAIVFDVYRPVNRPDARFSVSFGNLDGFDYEEAAPSANQVARSAGEGFVERTDPASIAQWGRIEGGVSSGAEDDDPTQIAQDLDEELAKSSVSLAISLNPKDTAQLVYGEDWELSDRVQVEIDGEVFTDLVREETFTWTAQQPEQIAAVIGGPEATAPQVPRLFAAQRRASTRLYQLERRV